MNFYVPRYVGADSPNTGKALASLLPWFHSVDSELGERWSINLHHYVGTYQVINNSSSLLTHLLCLKR